MMMHGKELKIRHVNQIWAVNDNVQAGHSKHNPAKHALYQYF